MIWRPLLEGDLAIRSLQAVEDVAHALESYTPPTDDLWSPSLSGGEAGEAYLALHNGDEHQADRAAALLETAAQFLATTVMPPGLYSGFSGVAWVAEHLQTRLFEPDPKTTLLSRLVRRLQGFPETFIARMTVPGRMSEAETPRTR